MVDSIKMKEFRECPECDFSDNVENHDAEKKIYWIECIECNASYFCRESDLN